MSANGTTELSCQRCGREYPDSGPAPEQCPYCDAYRESETAAFDEELGKLISELAARPVEIDRRRVRWCLDHDIPPFANVADGGYEAWQLVTDKELEDG